MIARYYSSSLGRFTAVDAALNIGKNLLNPQGWNRYTYAANNPLKYWDPDGRDYTAAADSKTKTVTIKVNVILAGATSQQAAQFQSQANSTWAKGPSTFTGRDGSQWNLKVEVKATVSAEGVSTKSGPNYMYVGDSGKTEMTSHNTGNLNANDLKDQNTAGHEVGHMIGLTDQYDKSDPKNPPLPGKEGSLMGDPKNAEAAPTQEEVQQAGESGEQAAYGSPKPEKKKE
jgi:hypothetical protein